MVRLADCDDDDGKNPTTRKSDDPICRHSKHPSKNLDYTSIGVLMAFGWALMFDVPHYDIVEMQANNNNACCENSLNW